MPQDPNEDFTQKMTQAELRLAISDLRSHLSSGMTDDEAMEELRLDALQYEQLKRRMYERETERLRNRPAEEIYTDYILQQLACVKDLSDAADRFSGAKQSTAYVGAIKARSEIWDKIIKQGQELGIIDKEPEKLQFLGGVAVADLSEDKLRTLITGELQNLNTMMETFGKTNSIMELSPGPLHRPAEQIPGGKKRAQMKGESIGHSAVGEKNSKGGVSNRVHSGRRVVRGKGS